MGDLTPIAEVGDVPMIFVGIRIEDIGDTIITHAHYDHAGNTSLLPRPRFHIQEREMAFATGKEMRHAFLRHAGHPGPDGAGAEPRPRLGLSRGRATTTEDGSGRWHANDRQIASRLEPTRLVRHR